MIDVYKTKGGSFLVRVNQKTVEVGTVHSLKYLLTKVGVIPSEVDFALATLDYEEDDIISFGINGTFIYTRKAA